MFDGDLNVQLRARLFKVNDAKLIVMRGVEHIVLLFFNDVSQIPIVHKTISSHKAIYINGALRSCFRLQMK